jgi:lysophospholipase L1-like esterase
LYRAGSRAGFALKPSSLMGVRLPRRPMTLADSSFEGGTTVGLSVRPLRSRIGLTFAVVLALVGASEVALRLSGALQPVPIQAAEESDNKWTAILQEHDNPQLGYANVPSIDESVGGESYWHDARGRRVPVEPSLPSDSSLPCVAFLGDSTTYGLGLSAREGLVEQTTKRLGGSIRSLNLGVCGYATEQEVALYAAERHNLPGVELVVLVVFPNDFTPIPSLWDESRGILYFDPMPLPRGLRHLLWNSALYRATVSVTMKMLEGREESCCEPQSGLSTMAKQIERLAVMTREDGRSLLVAHLPAMVPLDPYAFAEAERKLESLCAEQNVDYVDLLDGFLDERERQCRRFEAARGQPLDAATRTSILSMYWLKYPTDQHLNAAGNRVASGPLAAAVGRALHPKP